jgi:hypothetical protein
MSAAPQRKVVAGGLAGALSVITTWALNRAGVDVDAQTALAFNTIFVFLVQYAVPNKAQVD